MNWVLLLLVLAICPLTHFWMMKKGGHKHGGHKKETKERGEEQCHIVVDLKRDPNKKE